MFSNALQSIKNESESVHSVHSDNLTRLAFKFRWMKWLKNDATSFC